ncbi:MAG: DNA recombination/repair protein RecA [Anaerolineae bacterium]|nr:DNA recombination/repair protein RecA [Anaerolineae bacterium]
MQITKPDLHPILAALQRQGDIRPLADLPASSRTPAIPTGFPALDHVLACGGIPRGRLTILTGAPTSGTTSLAYRLVAQAQHRGQIAVYLDLPYSFDPLSAQRCGVKIGSLLLVRPSDRLQALALLRDLTVEDIPLLAVWDGLLIKSALPDLRALRAVLPRSRMTVLLRLPPTLAATVAADVHLHLVRQAWLYERRDVRGCQSSVTIQKDIGQPSGASVEIEIAL